MYERAKEILAVEPGFAGGIILGRSREGRSIRGYRLGHGSFRVSLVAGSHADEPVGPRLLRRLATYLASLEPDDEMLTGYEWWLIPHLNPDGEERTRAWTDAEGERFDPNTMEAMMRVPTEEEGQDEMVHQVFQKGYMFKDQLVRPARVSVYKDDD